MGQEEEESSDNSMQHVNINFRRSEILTERTLLDEIQELLPQSYMIFLLADLRLMSGTGRIQTKYESIALDSDICPKTTASQLAGITSEDDDNSVHFVLDKERKERIHQGLSPVQIMAVLLLELKYASDEIKKEHCRDDEENLNEHFLRFYKDPKRKEVTSLLRAYSRMIASDLQASVPHINRRRSQANLEEYGDIMTSPASNFAGSLNLDSIRERDGVEDDDSSNFDDEEKGKKSEEEKDDDKDNEKDSTAGGNEESTKEAAEEEFRKPMNKALSMIAEGENEKSNASGKEENSDSEGREKTKDVEKQSVEPTCDVCDENTGKKKESVEEDDATGNHSGRGMHRLAQQILARRPSILSIRAMRDELQNEVVKFLPPNNDALTKQEVEELTHALFDMGRSNANLKASIGSKSPAQMAMLMKRAVESRKPGRLQFMSTLFREGTVSQLMVESTSRIVWMNDWYPLKDLTYAIAVDKALKRVLVVFRGAITKEDWSVITHCTFQKVENPVQEDFEGKSKTIKVYTGFYRYLFRKRKDTGTTKYHEIANMADKYGRKEIGSEYNLVVTGHSLGAALTTIFCLYASTEERFTKSGPVKAFAFAGPYCGGHSFADTFRYQEKMGRLQYVRVFNDNDMVPHLPFNVKMDRRGCYWRHVGIGVRLPAVPYGFCNRYVCCWNRWWHPRVFYIGREKSWLSSTARGYGNNVFFHFPWRQPWNFARMHTLFELQDRLMYGVEVRNLGGELELLQKTVDELYNILHKTDFTGLMLPKE